MKNLFKRLICLSLVLLMLALCACNTADTASTPTEAPTEEPTEEPTEAPTYAVVSAVVLKNKKAAGEYIKADDVELAEVSEELLPTDYFKKLLDVIGKWAAEDLEAGAYLGESSITNVSPNSSNKTEEKEKSEAEQLGYVVITNYLKANTGVDVSKKIQQVIEQNPNKTIFFPDGEYILANPICTPADPTKSVSLKLSNYAVLKAASGWEHTEAMVRLGGIEPYNSISINGSNYYFEGGIVDGNGVANGISIDSGRETSVRNVSIKHTYIGLHIKHGANNGSSDADIDTVNIVGNNKPGSIGAYVVGYDNTLTNMRIASVQKGVVLEGAGNFMRNLHPLFIYGGDYEYKDSIGFDDQSGGNWYDFCYSDQFATGFRMAGHTLSTYQTCFCFWYKKDTTQVGFRSTGKFNSTIWNTKVNLAHTDIESAYLIVESTGGGGRIDCPIFDTSKCTDNTYKSYLTSFLSSGVVWPK